MKLEKLFEKEILSLYKALLTSIVLVLLIIYLTTSDILFIYLKLIVIIGFIVLAYIFKLNRTKKVQVFLNSLSEEEVGVINKELETLILHVKNLYALTDSYIIDIAGRQILKYQDIIWFYRDEYMFFRGGGRMGGGLAKAYHLIIITENGEKHRFLNNVFADPKSMVFSEIVKDKCPNALYGKTQENIDILIEKHNLDFSSRVKIK
jgi:hypothetical protein